MAKVLFGSGCMALIVPNSLSGPGAGVMACPKLGKVLSTLLSYCILQLGAAFALLLHGMVLNCT